MATAGPLPKRNAQRAGHRAKSQRADEVEAFSTVAVPKPDQDWHAIAIDWYVSLDQSVQARYYEPSDWQTARIAAELISVTLKSGRPSANAIAAITSLIDRLNVTEYSRRRSRIEGKRPQAEDEESESPIAARLKALGA